MNGAAVLYSFGLYILYVLLPIVPAVVLFRLFPDTKVAVSGPLQNLTLNATGAFAAYVVTVGLGYFVVQNVEDQIKELTTAKVWTVEVPVQLVDSGRKPITISGRITGNDTNFDFDQSLYSEAGGKIFIEVPIENERWRTILVTKAGFQSSEVALQSLIDTNDPTKVKINWAKRSIEVLEPLILTQVPAGLYAETQSPLAESSLAELRAGSPGP
jgi:hypothetical protein